jgi:hypothetical protein
LSKIDLGIIDYTSVFIGFWIGLGIVYSVVMSIHAVVYEEKLKQINRWLVKSKNSQRFEEFALAEKKNKVFLTVARR